MEEIKARIESLLMSTNRAGMDKLLEHMDDNGFYESPCSGAHHLSREGGLAEHSLNVYQTAIEVKRGLHSDVTFSSLIIACLLHDLGKMGDYGKAGYVPNMLKGRATKANPNPEPYQSAAKPYVTNSELLYIPHEIRSIAIARQFIELTEEEEHAILFHNGKYTHIGYDLKETPLQMIVHFADLWSSRVVEIEEIKEEED